MNYFNITVLTIVLFFKVSGVFGSAAASSSSSAIDESSGSVQRNAYGLTQAQQEMYTGAMRDYMLRLNQICRYPKSEETSLSLPRDFFELRLVPHTQRHVCVVYLKAGKSFSAALDSLLTLKASDKHIIDCTLAASFSELQGVRAILGNDTMFDKICNMLSGDESGDSSKITELTQCVSKPSFISNFFTKGEKLIPGALCYLEQLNDQRYFSFDGGPSKPNLSRLATTIGHGSIYGAKHPKLCMRGLNVLMIDDTHCVFFEPDQGVTLLVDAIKLLIDGLDADLTAEESKGMSTVVFDILSSIKYKDKVSAAAQILANVQYFTPDFTKVFACAITIKARDEAKTKVTAFLKALQAKGGTDWLKIHGALKGMPLIAQSHFLEGLDPSSPTDEILSAISKKSKAKSKM